MYCIYKHETLQLKQKLVLLLIVLYGKKIFKIFLNNQIKRR